MAKLYFRYGTMGSSKTAGALMTRFNYEEKGNRVLLLKPSVDTRDGADMVRSRIGLEARATMVMPDSDMRRILTEAAKSDAVDCMIIDEAQFLSAAQVEALRSIAEDDDIPVFCYGLRTDFMSHLFEGSRRLFELADSISEVKSICHCGRKASINAKYTGEGIVYQGNQIDIGGNEKYVALCHKCWKEGRLH